MAIEFHCSQCGALLRTPDGTAGQDAQCPQCRAITRVPEPSGSWPPAGAQRETMAWDGGPSARPLPRGAKAGAEAAAAGEGFAAMGGSPFGGPRGGENPYQSPGDYGYAGAPYLDTEYRERARQRVAGPAVGLILTGGLGLLVQLGSTMTTLASLGVVQGNGPAFGPAELAVFVTALVFNVVFGVTIVWGGIWMKNLRSYALAVTASILAMIPCFSPCCLLGLPIGIWALVVLSEPGVKAAFS